MAMGHGMSLVFHGGLCCGIKTIYNMQPYPGNFHGELKAIERDDRDQYGSPCSSEDRFFHDEAPRESGFDRIRRYIDYMKRRRPCNVLEVVLNSYQTEAGPEKISQYNRKLSRCEEIINEDRRSWPEVLKSLGFVKVTEHFNSNSGNKIYIYHLKIDEDYPGRQDKESAEDDYEEDYEEDYEDEE